MQKKKKSLKKVLTNPKGIWYNMQAAQKKGKRETVIENWTTKREVQSISKCEIQISSKGTEKFLSNIYSKK